MLRTTLLFVLGTFLLTGLSAQDASTALRILRENHDAEAGPVPVFTLSSEAKESRTGIRHYYFQQEIDGIPVRDGHAAVHFAADGSLLYQTHRPVMAEPVATAVAINREKARRMLSAQLPTGQGIYDSRSVWVTVGDQLRRSWEISGRDEQTGNYWVGWIDASSGKLIDHIDRTAECTFNAKESEGHAHRENGVAGRHQGHYDVFTPGSSGESTREFGRRKHTAFAKATGLSSFPGIYRSFALPAESPLSDVRTLYSANELADPIASPYGWHDTDGDAATAEFVYTRGNNTYAYYANPPIENPNAVPILRDPLTGTYAAGNVAWPAGNSMVFDYDRDLNQPLGSAFVEDAVTNLFVTVNQLHDLFYRYGFDEAAGNFQTTNYDGSPGGGDAVFARAQDGGGVNQASFSTPPDGMPPTMRMHLWSTDQPNSARDGSFDNAIIAHEYGHGVAYRLIQGAVNTDCFFNFEQGGEGWSDFFGLLVTLQDRDGDGNIGRNVLGEGIRGLGHWMLARQPDNPGLRPRHYTSHMRSGPFVNEYTYADLPALGFPHGTGFLWSTMLWDLTLDLMDAYGFEPNLRNATSGAGNVRAMHLVVEGLKLTPCNPDFIDMRDAILAADRALYGGAHQDLIWGAFARRGLGYSASPGGAAAFDTPYLRLDNSVSTQNAFVGETFSYHLDLQYNLPGNITRTKIIDAPDPRLTILQLPGGSNIHNGEIRMNNLGSIQPGERVDRSFTVRYDGNEATEILADYPVELDDLDGFVTAGAWIPVEDNPNPNSNSTRSWFHIASGVATESSLVFQLDLTAGRNNHLAFYHDYDLEYAIDGGVLEILVDGNWVDAGDRMLSGGYRAVIRDDLITPVGTPVPFTTLSRRRAWTGSSDGYQRCVIDLSDLSGTYAFRFRFASNTGNEVDNCAGNNGCDGWFIDDLQLLDLVNVTNVAWLTAKDLPFQVVADVGRLGTIIWPAPAARNAEAPVAPSALPPVARLTLSPNPTDGRILTSWGVPLTTAAELEIYDLNGRRLRRVLIQPGLTQFGIDVSDLSSGMYLVQLTQDNRRWVEKLVVK